MRHRLHRRLFELYAARQRLFALRQLRGPHPFVEEEYFNAEFTVASVERLDEPQQPEASETRVASLESAPQQDVRR